MSIPSDQPASGRGDACDDPVVDAVAVLHWASELLDVPAELDRATQRSVVLRKLADNDFMVWDQAHVAITLLAGSEHADVTAGDRLTIAEGAGRALQKDVDSFGQHFFDLPPQQRRQSWNELRSECAAYPALDLRLNRLEAGLDVVPHAATDVEGTAWELIDLICREFAVWPSQAARLRRAALKRLSEDPRRWSDAANSISRKRPDIARLTPTFLAQVQQLRRRERRMKKGRHKREKLQRPQPLKLSPSPGKQDAGGTNWSVFALLVPLFLVLRACIMTMGPATTPPRPNALDFGHQEELRKALESIRTNPSIGGADGRPLNSPLQQDGSGNPNDGRVPFPWKTDGANPANPPPGNPLELPADWSKLPHITPPRADSSRFKVPSRPPLFDLRPSPGGSLPSDESPRGPSPPLAPGGSSP